MDTRISSQIEDLLLTSDLEVFFLFSFYFTVFFVMIVRTLFALFIRLSWETLYKGVRIKTSKCMVRNIK